MAQSAEHMREMREKAARTPRKPQAKATHHGRAKNRREPGELRTRSDAIQSFCSECITGYGLDCGGAGSVKAAIKCCTSTKCHLWPWRLGALDRAY
jgi:hypothetical protein